MVFNSSTFFIFFCIFFAVYICTLNHKTIRNCITVIASFTFYGFWDWRFLSLIAFCIIFNHHMVNAIHSTRIESKKKRNLTLAIAVNLCILAAFKYFNFFIDSFLNLTNSLFGTNSSASLNIILPVGISFFTFQAISYVVDSYRKQIPNNVTLLDFAVYISLFPQLVAGPIVRSSTLIPQIQASKVLITKSDILYGLHFIVWGFFLKLALAENAAPIADRFFNAPELGSGGDALVGTLAFSLQIYGDFAGYSLIAIGLGRLMGYQFGQNFKRPYFANSFSDFWRRWHISLSSWLRDYLYISLGGNRNGERKTYRNLFTTMLLGGLWHGASWNFIIWGALHGIYLVIERFCQIPERISQSKNTYLRFAQRSTYKIGILVAVAFAWIFFRAETLSDSAKIISAIASGSYQLKMQPSMEQIILLFCSALIVLAYDALEESKKGKNKSWEVILSGSIAFVMLLIFGRFNNSAFIYFQF